MYVISLPFSLGMSDKVYLNFIAQNKIESQCFT